MSTITKEQLRERARQKVKSLELAVTQSAFADSRAELEEELELARIALASLEAEDVGEVVLGEYDDCGCHPDARVACIASDGQADWENFKDGTRLFTAPPASAVNAEPVSFDALRDAVAEVSGAPAMEWSDIYKGHQAVPFINFNSLARIVDKFRAAPPAPVSVPAAMEMDDDFDSAFEHGKAVGWNAYRAAMLQSFGNSEQLNSPVIPDAEPVTNRDELPEVVLHMGQAMSVFEALKKEVLYEHVRHAELGAMGAVNVQVWTSVLGGTLQYETSNGGCTLRVTQAAPQQEA